MPEPTKSAILIMELKGFAALATELAKRMEHLGVTPERIRQAGRSFINDTITTAERETKITPADQKQIGGDTWYFVFRDCHAAVRFGAELLSQIHRLATAHGLYYLKPSLALNIGIPRVSGDRFLDDASIAAYRVADSGEPFLLQVLPSAEESALEALQRLRWKRRWVKADRARYAVIDWMTTPEAEPGGRTEPIQLSTLLMDNDVVFFRSTQQVLEEMIVQQQRARRMFIYGGPAPTGGTAEATYKPYVRSLRSVFERSDVQCVVHNYFYPGDTGDGANWLALFRALSMAYPGKLAYSAVCLSANTPKPLSFHVYDDVTMLMLRRYDPMRGRAALSASMMLRNVEVAKRFEDDCNEGVRAIGGPFKTPSEFDQFERLLGVGQAAGKKARLWAKGLLK